MYWLFKSAEKYLIVHWKAAIFKPRDMAGKYIKNLNRFAEDSFCLFGFIYIENPLHEPK